MLPIKYVSPVPKKHSFKVDIVFRKAGKERKWIGVHLRPGEIQCFRYYDGNLPRDHHVSRHRSGKVPETLTAYGDYYPIRQGHLGTPEPFPFTLKLQRPPKPSIDAFRGVEALHLPGAFGEPAWFVKPSDLFDSNVSKKSRAGHQFLVDLDAFNQQLLCFQVLLVEPGNVPALETYLERLQTHPKGARVGTPSDTSVARITVRQAETYTGLKPWLTIAFLTAN